MALWDFPEKDFPLWLRLCSEKDDFKTFAEYQSSLHRLRNELREQGIEAVLIPLGVPEMALMLDSRGFENTGENRTEVLRDILQQTLNGTSLDEIIVSE